VPLLKAGVIPIGAEMRHEAELRSEAALVHAWVVNGGTDSDRFLSDIWRMLQRRAEESGGSLNRLSLPKETSSLEYFAAVDSRTLEALQQEVGVHRAQSVPVGSSSGRVETALVGVEIMDRVQAPSRVRPAGQVLRTYSYINGQAVDHSSGRSYTLVEIFGGSPSSFDGMG
jgi:PCRF domain